MLVYIYLSFKVYRYKAKLAAKNALAYTLTSAIRGTTGLIATNVHQLQTIDSQPVVRRDNQINENQGRKILIGDKPKSSASHGYILILVSIIIH